MNKVNLIGNIKSITFSHEDFGEKFISCIVLIKRLSGVEDEIPIIVSERVKQLSESDIGKKIYVGGNYRSLNRDNHLFLYVFADEIYFNESSNYMNSVELEGYIGRDPILRTTPLGRQITDLLLAVNRRCGKTDYIPCVTWGRNALFTRDIQVGSYVYIKGRIQSREYVKNESILTTYEVSVSQINIISGIKGSA